MDGQPARIASKAWLRALERSAAAKKLPDASLAGIVQQRASAHPDAPALLSDGVCWSYAELAVHAQAFSDWALAQGLQPGEAVCLLMASSPQYVAAWLGITRVGGVVALLNTNLVGEALLHCARAAAALHVIVDRHHAAQLAMLTQGLPGVTGWQAPLDIVAGQALPPPPAMHATALLIYTSGTTGLPKAARISHARLREWSHWFAGMMNVTAQDRMYNCLPMYHSVGGVVATGALLVSGGAVVISERFSASRFWDEIVRWDCTLFQYIGELCRYLVNAPPHPQERAHRLRLCCGNGLRAGVWQDFQQRFAIPAILEFYAATEGNVSLYNVEGRPGAIGREPGFLAHRLGVALVRLDQAGEPLRDGSGHCIRCDVDEPGEAIGRITDGNFEGYTDAAASERKILRNAFEAGDAWFRTGDLMRKDAAGFYSFLDRLGDTFRWKGENVSTTEVADVIAACPGVIDAVVFGVSVPQTEGRAGMAAIVADPAFRLDVLRAILCERLPDYARPIFLRLCRRIETTGTFKLAKAELARDGFAANAAGEPCYVDDRAGGRYVLLDDPWRQQISAGLRL